MKFELNYYLKFPCFFIFYKLYIYKLKKIKIKIEHSKIYFKMNKKLSVLILLIAFAFALFVGNSVKNAINHHAG